MSPSPRPIRAVVFDLDDTLYRERDYVRSGFAAVAEYVKGWATPAAQATGNGQRATRKRPTGAPAANPQSAIRNPQSLGAWMWREFLAGRREGMFDALSRHFRLGLTRADIARLVEVYRRHPPAIRPCRGVRRLLAGLHRRGLRLGLLSDGYLPAQQRKLAALGLRRHFDAVVFTEEIGRRAWKPSPRGFQRVRRLLGVPHAACAYVADNPAKDFLAPNRLGWLTIQWRRPGQVHAGRPAPAAGRPLAIVRSGPQLLKALGLQL